MCHEIDGLVQDCSISSLALYIMVRIICCSKALIVPFIYCFQNTHRESGMTKSTPTWQKETLALTLKGTSQADVQETNLAIAVTWVVQEPSAMMADQQGQRWQKMLLFCFVLKLFVCSINCWSDSVQNGEILVSYQSGTKPNLVAKFLATKFSFVPDCL